jgi:hypothetical protein
MNPRRISSLAAILCLVTLQASAGEVPFPQCPQALPVKQVVETSPANNWRIINNTAIRSLDGIGIHNEHPNTKRGSDIPNEEKQPNGDIIAHYLTSKYDYWVVCGYSNSTIVVTRKVPQNAVRCEVTYRFNQIAPNRVSIKCFDTDRDTKS